MRTKISILLLLAMSLFYVAGAKTPLTKAEAKKQIEQHRRQFLYDNFYLDKFVDKKRVHDNIAALKKEGYINLVSTKTAGPNRWEVIVLEKGKPLFVKEANNKLYFNVAAIEIKVLSIKERPGTKGSTTCYVEYEEKLTRNRFMELWGVTHCFDGRNYKAHALFMPLKDGWQMEKQDYEY